METRINSENGNKGSTLLNTTLTGGLNSLNLEGRTILDGKYSVLVRLNVVSGEADLYICTDLAANRFVAKIYRRRDAVKSEVLETLRNLKSPYIASICESGEYDGYPVVILPYFRNGSLAGKTFDYGTIRNIIVPNVTKGLKYLHENGIMHKDIKPSNLMISDDGERIEIIDFGISSVKDEGQSVLITRTGLSPEYCAPETFNNVFLNESDYYSLGITLYELFTGHTPFNNAGKSLSDDELAACASVQNIPFPESPAFPQRLKLLIKGLTYRDLSHRNESDNPNRRWVWMDVERWMNDEELQAPGEAVNSDNSKHQTSLSGSENSSVSDIPSFLNSDSDNHSDLQNILFPRPYDFKDSSGKVVLIQSLTEFVSAFGINWKEGKKHIGRELASAFFRKLELRSITSTIIDCEEADVTDEAYSKMLMELSAGMGEPAFYWNNRKINDVKEVSEYFNEKLIIGNVSESGIESEFSAATKLLRYWYELKQKADEIEIIDKIQRIADTNGYNIRTRIISFSSFFSEDMRLKIGDRIFDDVSELKSYAENLKNNNASQYFRWIMENSRDVEDYCKNENSEIYKKIKLIQNDISEEQERRRKEQEEIERIKKEQEEQDRIRKRNDFQKKFNVGSVVEFGKYYSQNNRRKEPVKWRVLSRDGNKALLITDKGIDCKQYHETITGITWAKCSLRRWLNTEFLETCFDKIEQSMIIMTRHKNNFGGETEDRIFLLSDDEARKYFMNDSDRKCSLTSHALNNGSWTYSSYCYWWLRDDFAKAYVDASGFIHRDGLFVNSDNRNRGSVRPALWLYLES